MKNLHRRQRDRKNRESHQGHHLFDTGWSIANIAEALLVDEATIRNWHEKYRQGGVNELLTLMYQGKAPSLTNTQQAKLSQHLDENTYLDSKEIRHHIAKIYGIEYSASGVKDLLHRLGFVYKKPKHVPGKFDPAKYREELCPLLIENFHQFQTT